MVFAPESVKPLNLPSLPLTWRKAFPDCPAIYFAISDKKFFILGEVKVWAKGGLIIIGMQS